MESIPACQIFTLNMLSSPKEVVSHLISKGLCLGNSNEI